MEALCDEPPTELSALVAALGRAFLISRLVDARPPPRRARAPETKNKNKPFSDRYMRRRRNFEIWRPKMSIFFEN